MNLAITPTMCSFAKTNLIKNCTSKKESNWDGEIWTGNVRESSKWSKTIPFIKEKKGWTLTSEEQVICYGPHAFARNHSHGKVRTKYFSSRINYSCLLSKYEVKNSKWFWEQERTFQEVFGETKVEIQIKVLATLGSLQ